MGRQFWVFEGKIVLLLSCCLSYSLVRILLLGEGISAADVAIVRQVQRWQFWRAKWLENRKKIGVGGRTGTGKVGCCPDPQFSRRVSWPFVFWKACCNNTRLECVIFPTKGFRGLGLQRVYVLIFPGVCQWGKLLNAQNGAAAAAWNMHHEQLKQQPRMQNEQTDASKISNGECVWNMDVFNAIFFSRNGAPNFCILKHDNFIIPFWQLHTCVLFWLAM